jgi:UDP-N-acetylglucosamine diphosphorylase / glucose-1-phosphate thymidylyltransferase / UDP-N-acetylgalactosamine diphosphorylase / glucosamine-1-phosphate N-acetyltransferase / galactosamine-1-phosphate N-acetyltransferase
MSNKVFAQHTLDFPTVFPDVAGAPWHVTAVISEIIRERIYQLSSAYKIKGDVAIHETAIIEEHVVLKGPLIISEGCFIGAHAYLRGGVFLDKNVKIGPGCEIKTSIVLHGTALAHFNFVGDSIVGSYVNMEAGSVIANHYNERDDKQIHVLVDGEIIPTGVVKFGALVGDGSRIGANAVLSPGTVLPPKSTVKRLELVEQVPYL